MSFLYINAVHRNSFRKFIPAEIMECAEKILDKPRNRKRRQVATHKIKRKIFK